METDDRKEITRIRAKRQQRKPLTPEELAYETAYLRKYSRCKQGIWIRQDKLKDWLGRAQASGCRSFSEYVHRIGDAYHRGDQDEVRELHKSIQALEAELSAARRMMGKLAEENAAKDSRLEGLERALADALRGFRAGVGLQ